MPIGTRLVGTRRTESASGWTRLIGTRLTESRLVGMTPMGWEISTNNRAFSRERLLK